MPRCGECPGEPLYMGLVVVEGCKWHRIQHDERCAKDTEAGSPLYETWWSWKVFGGVAARSQCVVPELACSQGLRAVGDEDGKVHVGGCVLYLQPPLYPRKLFHGGFLLFLRPSSNNFEVSLIPGGLRVLVLYRELSIVCLVDDVVHL